LWVLEVEGLRLLLGDINDVETTMEKHAWELALTRTYGDGMTRVVVADVDGGVLTLLVVVVGAFVLIELELTVLTSIDIEVDELRSLLVAPLHLGAEGNDGTLAHKDWDTLIRGGDDEPAAREFLDEPSGRAERRIES
jgi:hypothetical protein